MDSLPIVVVGGGLAGSQAALTIATLGGEVELFEMRPVRQTAAHRTADAAELVCSNSFRSNEPHSASGLLKQELRLLDSDLIQIADRRCHSCRNIADCRSGAILPTGDGGLTRSFAHHHAKSGSDSNPN